MPQLSTSADRARIYLPFLDGLRGLCALYVVLHHCWTQSFPIFDHPEIAPHGLIGWLTSWLAYGHYAVTVFIAISGFSLGLPVVRGEGRLRKGALDFFKRRAVRILPPYYVALALAYFIAHFLLHRHTGSAYDAALPATALGFWSHVFLVHDFWPLQYQADPPLWSIAVETQIYLFFPLLVFMRRKFGMGSVLLTSFAIGFGAFLGTSIYGAHQNTYYYLLVFAFGMLAADLCFGPRRSASITQVVLASAANVLILVVAFLSRFHHPTLRETELLVTLLGISSVYLGSLFRSRILAFSVLAGFYLVLLASLIAKAGVAADLAVCDTFVGVLATCLFVVCSLSPHALLTRLLSGRYLEALGAFSYSLYLIHAPFQQLLWQTFVAPLDLRRSVAFAVMAIGGTAVLIAIAYGFFLRFERPFLKRTRVGAMRAEVVAEKAVLV